MVSLFCSCQSLPIDKRQELINTHSRQAIGMVHDFGMLPKQRELFKNYGYAYIQTEKEMTTHSSILGWRIPGRGSLVGCHLCGRTEPDTTEATQQQQQYIYRHIHIQSIWTSITKIPQTGRPKQQTFISYSSGGGEVQDQGIYNHHDNLLPELFHHPKQKL